MRYGTNTTGCLDGLFGSDKTDNIIPIMGLGERIAAIKQWYADIQLHS